MKRKIGLKRAELYLREYPRLLRQIKRLVELVRAQDSNVALLALFGSTARLEPDSFSDADLLMLLHNPRVIYEIGKTAKVVQLIGEAERVPLDEWCDWTFSGMVGNADGSNLDADFLANVATDGVLLYQQEGTTLPSALVDIQSFDVLLEHVDVLLAECAGYRKQSGAHEGIGLRRLAQDSGSRDFSKLISYSRKPALR